MHISIDISQALPFLPEDSLESIRPGIEASWDTLMTGTGEGNDFLGWVRLPSQTDTAQLKRIREHAAKMREIAEVFVVIGIGGSYLGARAVNDALSPSFPALMKSRKTPLILYAGENLSEDYHADLLEVMDNYSCGVAVISKSGTTTEPAVAFRLIKKKLETKYGREGARERIIAITDASRGALKKIADAEGYETYVIPDDVGGRYSVLTPVGLLPIAVAGLDIEKLVEGAAEMEQVACKSPDFMLNPATLYAAIRNLLYRHGKQTEIMVTYQPHLVMLTEWWKQLFGESEGKKGKGIFPAGVTFTTDLHSMGQFIQEGVRHLFETVLSVERPNRELWVPDDPENNDGLNFLAGKSLSEVNHQAEIGTRLAHVDGGVPNIRISIPCLDAYHLGQLLYFYEFACGVSGYTLGINPFDQPGVEAYKRKMFELLGKPGY
ncbi:MAG: glucose-6-phosphate isomerase [Bacteroidales bacterium]|nr:glucose-6-phosphate isomerase [Bacteroidales bacterium]